MINKITVPITTASDGKATVYGGKRVSGRVVAINFLFGDLAGNVDFAIVGETSGVPVLTIANLAQADAWWYPRAIPVKNTDGSAFTDLAEPILLFNERIKVTVTDGGDTKSGSLVFYVDEELSDA